MPSKEALEHLRKNLLESVEEAKEEGKDTAPLDRETVENLTLYELEAVHYQIEGKLKGYLPLDIRIYLPELHKKRNSAKKPH